MAYEYEESNKQIVFTVDNESSMDELKERIKELKEVYRKAKAWEQFKEEKMNDYITWSNAEKRSDLIRMDKLDGTNEFSNLLSDLGDE